MTYRRMKDYLTADQLNTDGYIALAAEVLKEAARAYVCAAREYHRDPEDGIAKGNYDLCRRFYRSEYFTALSAGLLDGEQVMAQLEIEARGGKPYDEPGEAADGDQPAD